MDALRKALRDRDMKKVRKKLETMNRDRLYEDDHILKEAVATHDLAVVQLLFQSGAPINPLQRHVAEDTPLTLAVRQGDIEIVRYLLEHGADPTVRVGQSESLFAFVTPGDHEMLYFLLVSMVPGWREELEKLIHVNKQEKFIDVMDQILPKLNLPKPILEHYLLKSIQRDARTIAVWLMDRGAEPTDFILMEAIRKNSQLVLLMISTYGANIHVGDDFALYEAVRRANVYAVANLLRHNASWDARSGEIYRLAMESNDQIRRLFLDASKHPPPQRPPRKRTTTRTPLPNREETNVPEHTSSFFVNEDNWLLDSPEDVPEEPIELLPEESLEHDREIPLLAPTHRRPLSYMNRSPIPRRTFSTTRVRTPQLVAPQRYPDPPPVPQMTRRLLPSASAHIHDIARPLPPPPPPYQAIDPSPQTPFLRSSTVSTRRSDLRDRFNEFYVHASN